ncbi:MAG TPA: Flp pilus assembly protein CpaB [Candidatus Omnitrophota bacterium]|nr:Flp pilus assembly protein CpaB [Candidatus Omnitrophota bacterium]HPD84617.1 Flp pilus assembly protein CpaB [Candidatus Omnitrophota bacterium]HRZ03475.1 Flp pilus assembly protein CpaB [Candidatus Omnitrophota bacterium]
MPLPFDIKSIDKKKVIILAVAVILGLIAVFLTNNYIDTKEKAIVSSMGGMTRQQVAQLEERLKNVEGQNQMLASALQQQNASIQQEVQKMAASLSASSQTAEQVKSPVNVKTPPGKRAVTVVIDRTSAVGGLVAPGDYVDVIAHLNSPPESIKSLKTEGSLIVMLFQNIQILAIGDNTDFGRRTDDQMSAGSLSITFALNPHEANLLSFVQQNGSLQLILRPNSDGEAYILPSASWKTLAEYISVAQGKEAGKAKPEEEETDEEAEAAKEAAEKAKTIEIFK